MTQDELKAQAAQAALAHIQPGTIIGIGTGSTVNHLIDALAATRLPIEAAVSSSQASSQRLRALGIAVRDANTVEELDVYIDGADEIDPRGCMIKGGGAALTREKIVAAQSRRFICIADASKQVPVLGRFPLPVEIIPMAAGRLIRAFAALGGQARLRLDAQGQPVITDNGQQVLDVHGLHISDPLGLEQQVNQWPGVVTVGVFAQHKADMALLATPDGMRCLHYEPWPVGGAGRIGGEA